MLYDAGGPRAQLLKVGLGGTITGLWNGAGKDIEFYQYYQTPTNFVFNNQGDGAHLTSGEYCVWWEETGVPAVTTSVTKSLWPDPNTKPPNWGTGNGDFWGYQVKRSDIFVVIEWDFT